MIKYVSLQARKRLLRYINHKTINKMKRSILFTLLAAGLLAGCEYNEVKPTPTGDPVAAEVTASINQALPRVEAGDGQFARFAAGDVIYVVAGGVAIHDYTLQGDGSWSAGDNPYYFQSAGDVAFRAWYADPAVAPADNVIAIDTRTQPTGDNGWNRWDILATPQVTASATAPQINFTGDDAFAHVMAQVSFVLRAGDGIADLAALTGYTLKGMITDATFDTQTCTLAAGDTTSDIAVELAGASDAEHACAPLILVPQAVGTLDLDVAYNGQTYAASLDVPDGGLQAGYSYTYTVTISNTGLDANAAEISSWLPGEGGQGEATL